MEENIINSIIDNFDYVYILMVNIITYGLIKIFDSLNGPKPVSVLAKRVEFVERGELSGEALEHFLKNLFAPYQERKVDAVVLGCTHYPLVRKTIQKVLGSGVAVFDGGAGTARETLHKLKEYSLVSDAVNGTVFLNAAVYQDKTSVYVSGFTGNFQHTTLFLCQALYFLTETCRHTFQILF